jgi:PPP family 3-phenylpropionic acid transporter
MNVALGPLITWYGSGVVLWAIAANLAFGAVFGAIHPGGGAPPGAGLDQSRFREALRLSAHPVFLAFALAISVAQASHSIFYIYGTLIWTSQGIGAGTIGLLWGFGVFSEILLMIGPGRWMVARIGPARSMAIAALAGLVRWSVMAFEPGLLVLWPLQSLHAVTYAFGHLGAIAFVAAAVPPRLQASAQGLYAGGIGGIAAAAVMLLGAQVSGGFGMAAAYWLAAAMSAVALAAAMWLARIWDGGRLVADQP